MSLRRKILVKDVILASSLLLLIGSALWGFWRQYQHVQSSLMEYGALQRVEESATSLAQFQQAARAGNASQPLALADLAESMAALQRYAAVFYVNRTAMPPEITPDLQNDVRIQTNTLSGDLDTLWGQLHLASTSTDAINSATAADAADRASRELTSLLKKCNGLVNRTQLASSRDLRISIILVGAIALLMVATAFASSLWQYRKVILPLQGLREWCRHAAENDFSEDYQPPAEQEFQELGSDVNKMAAELSAFHRRLEAMVESKSRELVRSERLASVGYLAAGVAHEINNPLNVMSGYAELSLKRLRKTAQSATSDDLSKFINIIRSEAFRCKQITQKLLSLAKGNSDVREIMSLSDATNDVATMVRGLKSFRTKQMMVALDPDEPLYVRANETEMKQVLLNLVINAIEAVPEKTGEIVIDGRRAGQWVELDVCDNGRGMTAQTLERVFEPFFTNKRGAGNPGTGLGLSVTHAIVTHHGGEITAHSEGVDRGSRFTIRIPAADPTSDAPKVDAPKRGLRMPAKEAAL